MKKVVAYIFISLTCFYLIGEVTENFFRIKIFYALLIPEKYTSKDLLIITSEDNNSNESGFYTSYYNGYFRKHPTKKDSYLMHIDTFNKKAEIVYPEDKFAFKVWFIAFNDAHTSSLRTDDNYPFLFSYTFLNIWLCALSFIMFIPSITYLLIKKHIGNKK